MAKNFYAFLVKF